MEVREKVKTLILFYCLGSSIHLQAWCFYPSDNLPRSRNERISLKYSVYFSNFPFLSSGISAHLFIVKDEMCTLWYVINFECEVQILFGEKNNPKDPFFLH